MSEHSDETLTKITDLLHDATVLDVAWDRSLATFAITFDCLQRNPDGSDVTDRTVTLTLRGVDAVAVSYDSASMTVRPSEFEPGGRIAADGLADWPYRQQEAGLWINSPWAKDALDAARLDWHAGSVATFRSATVTFYLSFDQWSDFGMPMIHLGLLVAGDDFTITSGGVALDVDDWEQQFRAWWDDWKRHWDAKRKDEGNAGEAAANGDYEVAIPAGVSPSPDLTYRPPAEPPFEVEPTDAPGELLRPIRDWFEGHHAREWARMARAYPNPTRSLQDRAEQLERQHTGYDFGRWNYARQVDDWWVEGGRACVVVRGVEHSMPSDGDPAENWEMVWEFPLRRRGDEWTTCGHSSRRAWVGRHDDWNGGPETWRRRWSSGRVRSARTDRGE